MKDFKTGGFGINTIWTDKKFYTAKGTDIIAAIFGDKRIFNYSKPVDLIQEVLNRITDKDSIIREYIWFTETHTKLPAEKVVDWENEYFLGKHNEDGYWFYYNKKRNHNSGLRFFTDHEN